MSTLAKEEVLGQINKLLRLLEQKLKEDILPEEAEYIAFQQVFAQLERGIGVYADLDPQVKPATRHWEKALAMADSVESHDIVCCLENLTPYLRWMVNPGYRGRNVNKEFLENYSCFELIGPEGLFHNSTVTMGVMLLSPDIYYPPHAHPASECLYLLSGRGTWHLSDGPIISIPPGGHMLIPSGSVHAFWSMDTPLAAIYLCLGNDLHHDHSGIDLD